MSWQQQLQQAAQRPTEESCQRRCQSETVIQQQHRSVTEVRETTLAAPGMAAPRLRTAGPVASAGGEYLYPPEWQQRGRPQQSSQSPTWRHQLQQQQIWQQQQLQQQQGPTTQQWIQCPAAPALTVPVHFPQQQQEGSGYMNNGSRLYSHVDISPGVHRGEEDVVGNRTGYGSSRIGYSGTTAAVSYGNHRSSNSRNAQHGNDYWGQHQQLLLEQEHQKSAVQEVEEQCMQSLQSSLRVAAETNEISQNTAVKLEEQSEQLRGIRDTTVEIQENLQTSDYLLKGMKSWWGAFAQLFTSPPAAAKTEGSGSLAGNNVQRQQQPAAAPSSRNQSKRSSGRFAEAAGSGAVSTGLSRSSRDGSGERQQQLMVEDASSSQHVGAVSSDFDMRLEQDLQRLSEMLGEMHERAVAINSNLKQQNGMLGEIEKNVDANQSSITQQKKMLKEIMRK